MSGSTGSGRFVLVPDKGLTALRFRFGRAQGLGPARSDRGKGSVKFAARRRLAATRFHPKTADRVGVNDSDSTIADYQFDTNAARSRRSR